ncbi:MAG TPA: HAD hydrolase family protein [Pirellulales bacterium]|nr:HAD hydrolase family protein [Pirellulales bacterium]
MKTEERAARVELILSDVDGVMTDGSVVFDNQGIETKLFHIRDGLGIKLWRRAGYRFGVITGRSSQIVRMRAAELGVDIVRQGVEDKLAVVEQIVAELGLEPQQVCYVGDDLPDLPVVRFVGLGVAVADGSEDLRRAAHYVTTTPGGRGAVRETIELVLKAQGRWEDQIQKYGGKG